MSALSELLAAWSAEGKISLRMRTFIEAVAEQITAATITDSSATARTIENRDKLSQIDVFPTINRLMTADTGGSWKRLSAAPSPQSFRHIQSADGTWWELTGPLFNVLDCGADPTGLNDSTEAFKALEDCGGIAIVPAGTYKLNDHPTAHTINLGTGTFFLGVGWPTLNVEVGVLNPGDIGRNCFFINNSYCGVKGFKANCTSQDEQIVPNGEFQNFVNIGIPRLGTGVVDTLKHTIYVGDCDVTGLGPGNIHVVNVYGYVENWTIERVKAHGAANFPIVAHWSGDFDPDAPSGTATKGWHPCRGLVSECSVTAVNAKCNGYRVSGGAYIIFEGCETDADDAFELYPGDLGFQVAQNLLSREGLAGCAYNNCHVRAGGGKNFAFQASGNGNDGTYWRDIWYGSDKGNRAALQLYNCTALLTDSQNDALPLVASFFDTVHVVGGNFSTFSSSSSEYAAQFNCVNNIIMTGVQTNAKNGLRIRSCDTADISGCNFDYDIGTFDVTSIGISIETHTQTATLQSAISINDTVAKFILVSDVIHPGSQIIYGSGVIEVDGTCTTEDNTQNWAISTIGSITADTNDLTVTHPERLGRITEITIAGLAGTHICTSITGTAVQALENNVSGTVVDALVSIFYKKDQYVIHNTVVYKCIADHTPSAATEPGIGASWNTVWATSTSRTTVSTRPSPIAISAGQTVTIRSHVRHCVIRGGRCTGTRIGINTDGDSPLPYLLIDGMMIRRFGTRGIVFDNVAGGRVTNCHFVDGGRNTDTTDTRGVYVDPDAVVSVDHNYFPKFHNLKWCVYLSAAADTPSTCDDNFFAESHPTTSGSFCVFLGTAADTGRPHQFKGNRVLPGVVNMVSPTNTPHGYYIGRNFRGTITSVPTIGTWLDGDQLDLRNKTAGAVPGHSCVIRGTGATLTGITAQTTSGSLTVTLNSTTGVVAGTYITIAGMTGDREITSVDTVNNTITVDADPAVSVGPGAAVAYQAFTFKGWAALAA